MKFLASKKGDTTVFPPSSFVVAVESGIRGWINKSGSGILDKIPDPQHCKYLDGSCMSVYLRGPAK
jgi:hypothetical protein